MRLRTGCQHCRQKHAKCVRQEATDKCERCIDKGYECFQSVEDKFRPVTVRSLAAKSAGTREQIKDNSSQRWVELPSKVKFRPVKRKKDRKSISGQRSSKPQNITPISPPPTSASHPEEDQTQSVIRHNTRASPCPSNGYISENEKDDNSATPHAPGDTLDITRSETYSTPLQNTYSCLPVSPLSARQDLRASLRRSPNLWAFGSEREAHLCAHYVTHLAPWIDTCDPQSHFSIEVPLRIPFCPATRNAICALSAWHLCMFQAGDISESEQYAADCIEILIKRLDDPLAHWDENLLAAVVIMRHYEELSQEIDPHTHLFGTRKILDTISAFAADGGLREACSWYSLRQHIYVSLTQQRPLDINLDNFRHSSVFEDGSTVMGHWANRAIFIFAQVLEYIFPQVSTDTTHIQHKPERWYELQAAIQDWYDQKPWSFNPMWERSILDHDVSSPMHMAVPSTPHVMSPWSEQPYGSPLSNTTHVSAANTNVWPTIIVYHQAQVVGFQYYYMTKVLLAAYDPKLSHLGFAAHDARQRANNAIIAGVKNVVGLSVSNEHVPTAMFEAHHMLKICGRYFEQKSDQQAIIAVLQWVRRRTGWRTTGLQKELTAQWEELTDV